MQPTTQNMEKNNVRACSCTSLAQATGPWGLSLKLLALASSRLGEISSPERDYSSPKSEITCLSYNWSEAHQAPTNPRLGETFSPERDHSSLK